MKFLVTGGTGYVGVPLIDTLLQNNHQVRVLVRSKSKFKNLIANPNIEIVVGDLLDTKSLQVATSGCSAIFHLAAFADIWSRDPSIYEQINVEGTKNLLSAASAQGVKRILITSTAGVMGPTANDGQPVTEGTSRQPILFSKYDQSKYKEELAAFEFLKKGLEVIIVNPSRIYGPGIHGTSNSVSRLIDLFNQGKWRFIPGDGSSIGNYVYIDDIVNGHLLAMERGSSGQRYILGGENISYRDLFTKLNKLTGRHQKLFKIPIGVLLIWSYSELLVAKLTGRKPMIVPAFVKKLSHNWNLSSDKAKRELGYHFIDFETGLKKTLDWIIHE